MKMKVRVSELRKLLNKAIMEVLQAEDHSAHSKDSGYSSEVEESISREKRAEHGYGNEDTPEYDDVMETTLGASDPNKFQPQQSANQSAALHTRDKSQMQGVGPRPGMDTAFAPIGGQKEAMTGATNPNKPQMGAQASANLHTRDKSQMQGVGPRPTMATAFGDQPPKKEAAGPSDKAEDFMRKNKADYKKRYGARWKDALYADAAKKSKK